MSLVDAGKDTLKVASTFLAQRDQTPLWPDHSTKEVACDIVSDLIARDMPVDVTGLCRPGASPTCCATKSPGQIPAILGIFTAAGHVASLLGHLLHSHVAGRKPYTKDGHVLPECDVALQTIDGLLRDVSTQCSRLVLDGDEDVPWVFPLDKVDHWVKCARHAGVGVKREIVSEAVVSIRAHAASVQKKVPSWEGIFRHADFDLPMAYEALYLWPARQQLHDGCTTLFVKLQELSRTWSSWGGSPSLLEDSVWKKISVRFTQPCAPPKRPCGSSKVSTPCTT